jgi:hypothetical protein
MRREFSQGGGEAKRPGFCLEQDDWMRVGVRQRFRGGQIMGRALLLWIIGIPIPIILLVWLLGGFH